ncbi:PAQR family membrane homeostasis protein TrhA [Phyllobacterium lublinensis]|uniref:PAQR family membrane homeostasis protein TrhA n=1 Tax=Phyllobacterium lublinensis TaxID=2875708 RepID=UPI001CCC9700|nr:hemolysin III family protein [Phyllobacterium sp. 2063]MBZ9656018.1 hemolysin III family protein [Phyllobacterium sp. 2063]
MREPGKAAAAVIYRDYSLAELRADGAIHIIGVILAIAGSIALLAVMVDHTALGAYVATAIYLATLVLSITISAVYNVLSVSPAKLFLRRFDHSAIYLLIAGTYTPFIAKTGTWWLLATVWAIAAAGVLLKLLLPNRFDRLSIVLYLALGWSGVAAYHDLAGTLSASILWLILTGGIVYSLGVIFHVFERLPFHNAIWHGFVLVAASIHYAAVCSAVV